MERAWRLLGRWHVLALHFVFCPAGRVSRRAYLIFLLALLVWLSLPFELWLDVRTWG
jgi:hypothetical protein